MGWQQRDDWSGLPMFGVQLRFAIATVKAILRYRRKKTPAAADQDEPEAQK